MIRGSAIFAAISVLQVIQVGPLAAEPRDTMRMAQAIVAPLPPYEMHAIVRSMGMRPIGPAMREGPNYVLRAIGRRGEERRVVIDARYGEVIESVPVVRMPGYPESRVVRLPDREFDDDSDGLPPPVPPRVIPAPRAMTPPAPLTAPAPRAAAVTPTERAPTERPAPRPRREAPQTASAPPPAPAPSTTPSASSATPVPPAAKPVEQKPAEPKPKIFVPDVAPLD